MFIKFKKMTGLLVVLVCLLAFLPGQRVYAAGSYRVGKYDSTWEVQPNGNVKVTETIEFDINGDINGLFRDVDVRLGSDIPNTPANQVGIDNVSVAVLENGVERPVYMIDQGLGSDGKFEFFKQSSNLYRFKVYETSNNERKTIRFRYTLTNVIVKYNDIATLNWIMIDRNWTVPLENIKMTITIPDGAKQSDLRIFSHGDLTGFNEIIDNKTFNVEIAIVNPGDTVENLVIFPLSLVPDSKKLIDRTELQTILTREAAAAEAANLEREAAKQQVEEYRKQREAELAREAAGKRMNPFIFGAGALSLAVVGFIFARYGKQKKPTFTGDYYRELPGDYTPAVMSSLLYNGRIESKDIMATLMDLARKKVISIEPYSVQKRSLFGAKDETDYRLISKVVNDSQLTGLTNHEQYLYDWFINDLGNGTTLAMDDLEVMLKKTSNAYQFNRDYDTFKNFVQSMAQSEEFTEPNNTVGSGVFYLIALALLGFGIFVIVYYGNILGVIPIIGAGLIFVANIVMKFTKKLTTYGVEQTAMWKAFKKFLLTFSNMDKAEIPALAIWNHYLVYATSLGVAKEVIDQLPKVYTMEEMKDPRFTGTFYPDFYYGRGFYAMDRSINNAITTATRTIQKAEQVAASRSSSSSGGGGGFSGGSSGGGGGGGGGGTF